ncbi:MAG: BlaI/MecI/CopY family transcriptional regulator [Planctomycetes bacterium]|nr:BlaI/MecI/CopY family transcriptional regulator [Planctomycetota bacterium]
MSDVPEPTERELQILKVLWEHGEATVRQVYQVLRDDVPIVQNTVQAFLRTMEDKGLVTHRLEGRTFVYRSARSGERHKKSLLSGLLDSVFDGALDQLVASALQAKKPSQQELTRLRELLSAAERKRGSA